MQIGIDTWFLESLFARFKLAGRLVDNIDDPIVADELAKSINEVNRRLAELLGKPYDPQAAGDPSGSQAAGDPTEDGEPDELELATWSRGPVLATDLIRQDHHVQTMKKVLWASMRPSMIVDGEENQQDPPDHGEGLQWGTR